MRVVAVAHYYVPFRNAGSETMLHRMLRALSQAGHEVTVYATDIPQAPPRYLYEGIEVLSSNMALFRRDTQANPPDVFVSHHYRARGAGEMSKRLNVPGAFVVHSEANYTARTLAMFNFDLVVYNSYWLRDTLPTKHPSMVLHPPVDPEEHRADPGDRVTLVNMSWLKGAHLLYRLAETMPDVPFLGVEGGYDEQILRTDLPNVEIVRHTNDMPGDVWSRTRILLMPSSYESYGMAGVEALASGIPVIANPTPGLRESLGFAGVFVDRDDEEGYRREIRRLLDPTEWADASSRALTRSRELDPSSELKEWVARIEELTR